MKYVPKEMGEAEEASNGGKDGWGREIAWLVGGVLALLLLVYVAIGWLVELALPWVSVEREKAWFGGWEPSAVMRGVVEPEGEMVERLALADLILGKMKGQPGVPGLDYRLRYLVDREPNAFAFPGGAIGVTQGLLTVLEEEVALAFVIGHELGHFAQRDHLRGMGRGVGRAVFWGLIFGGGGPDMLGEMTGGLLDRAHSRKQEAGADRFGVELVWRVYGTTEGTETLFEWLEASNKQPGWVTWLSTHPDSGDRIRRMREHAAGLRAE